MPNHSDRVRRNYIANTIPPSEMKEPKITKIDREEILRKAYVYKDNHPDEFIRVLAQIAIYHYGD